LKLMTYDPYIAHSARRIAIGRKFFGKSGCIIGMASSWPA